MLGFVASTQPTIYSTEYIFVNRGIAEWAALPNNRG